MINKINVDGVDHEIVSESAEKKIAENKEKLDTLVVNDLTTGGADKALSAEMGKELAKEATTEHKGLMSVEDKKTIDHTYGLVGICKLEQGGINTSNGENEPGSKRLRTLFLAPPVRVELKEGFSFVGIVEYDSNYNYVRAVNSTFLNTTILDSEHLYRFSIKKNDNTDISTTDGPITSFSGGSQLAAIQQEERRLSVENSCADNDIIVLEPGGINLSTGQLQEYDHATRARTKDFFKAPLIYELNEGYKIIGIVKYQLVDGDYSYVESLGTFNIEYGDGYYYKFSVKRADNSNISVADNIFKTLLCGSQAISIENRTRSIANESNIAAHQEKIVALDTKVANVMDNFEHLTLQGYSPNSYTLSGLQTLETGNVGLPVDTRISTSTATYTIRPQYKNIGNYVLSAMVVTGLEDVSVVGDSALFTLSLNANYGINANYQNIITTGVRVLNDSTVLVYNVSGRIETQNNQFASTIYARLTKNIELTFGISKMLVMEIDEWNEDYIDILIGNSLNESIWIDNYKLELWRKDKVVLGRDLFSGIAFWGSSSTEGSWVKNVANNLNMPYYWGGVGGENIWAIMGRMGVLPLRIPTSFIIPASKDVPVQIPESYQLKVRWNGSYKSATVWVSSSVQNTKVLDNPCYIAGVKGNLIGSGNSNGLEPLQFQRLEDGDAVTTKAYEPIYTLGFREARDCVWFLACHFNGGQSSTEELVELYKKMYNVSCSKKVLILGRHKVANGVVTSPTLETLQEQETALEDEFGLMFFNTREYMCGRGFERFKELYPTNYTTTDIEQASQGITPDCMYVSANNVHFNDKGYVILTEAVTQRLIELGYNLFRYGGDVSHPKY